MIVSKTLSHKYFFFTHSIARLEIYAYVLFWFVSVSVSISGGTVDVSQVSWNYFIFWYITKRVWRYEMGYQNPLIEGKTPNGQNKQDKQ